MECDSDAAAVDDPAVIEAACQADCDSEAAASADCDSDAAVLKAACQADCDSDAAQGEDPAMILVAEQDPHELTEEETDDLLTMLPQIFERTGWNMREMTAAMCAQIGRRCKRGSGRKFTEKMYRVFKAKWLDDPHAVENWIEMAAEQDIVLEL